MEAAIFSRGQVSPTARIAADARERAMVGFDVNERLGDDSRADRTTRQATSLCFGIGVAGFARVTITPEASSN